MDQPNTLDLGTASREVLVDEVDRLKHQAWRNHIDWCGRHAAQNQEAVDVIADWERVYRHLQSEFTDVVEAWHGAMDGEASATTERDLIAAELESAQNIVGYLEGRLESILRGAGAADSHYVATSRTHNERLSYLEKTIGSSFHRPASRDCISLLVERVSDLEDDRLERDLNLDTETDD